MQEPSTRSSGSGVLLKLVAAFGHRAHARTRLLSNPVPYRAEENILQLQRNALVMVMFQNTDWSVYLGGEYPILEAFSFHLIVNDITLLFRLCHSCVIIEKNIIILIIFCATILWHCLPERRMFACVSFAEQRIPGDVTGVSRPNVFWWFSFHIFCFVFPRILFNFWQNFFTHVQPF